MGRDGGLLLEGERLAMRGVGLGEGMTVEGCWWVELWRESGAETPPNWGTGYGVADCFQN